MPRLLLFAWIPMLATAPLSAAEPALGDPPITPKQRQHWAYRPPVRPAIPIVRDSSWIRTPIDSFILAKLEVNGLRPSPQADRLTWLRRVTFDLTGLPPTSAEQEAFLADRAADAYENVVDRLLASPHYGERWAQHWLDVVRYAESNGYEADAERPHAWRYRDYVARSFAADKPFNQFVIEQVAGDRLWKSEGTTLWNDRAGGWFTSLLREASTFVPDPASFDPLIATGMHRCGPMHFVGGNVDPENVRQEILTEIVNGLSSSVLGMTVGCARCHDHKFDPISAGDYYRLQAFFAATQLKDRDLATPAEKAEHARQEAAIRAKVAPLQAKVASLEGPYRKKLSEMKHQALEPAYRDALAAPADKRTAEQKKLVEHANILLKITWDEVVAALTPDDRARRQTWRDEIHALEAHLPPPTAQAWAVADEETVPATYVLKRGEVKNRTVVVGPGFPRILVGENQGVDMPRSLNRLDLARWLTRSDHPLTGRVWVNRVWQHHFGRGLVGTPNDFGTRGERPSHPELLDWLATELPRRGWSTKALHRLMVLSATYRQSAMGDRQLVDPDNRLLGRMNRRRLEGETLRDAMLAAAGTLNRALGGPRVLVPLEPEVYDLIFTEGEPDGLWKTTPDEHQHLRRSLYLFAKRNVRMPLLEAFDQPDTLNPCPVRPVSTFAPQALILMNGPLAQAQSKAFATRLMSASGAAPEALVERAFRLALGRPPRSDEAKLGASFLREQAALLHERLLARLPVGVPSGIPGGIDPALAAALADFCLTIFNLNEFIYVD